MNGFRKGKEPEFIKHIDISIPKISVDEFTLATQGLRKLSVQIADQTDNLIIDGIREIAEKEGITDLYIINKENVVAALKKQIPQKPLDICTPVVTWGICPNCQGEISKLNGRPARHIIGTNYCPDCGQALDWSVEDESTK